MKKLLLISLTVLQVTCGKKNSTNDPGPTPTATTVTICSQTWMIKNLDVATYRNGDPIPKVADPTAWAALTTGAYCYYNNDSATYAVTYGKLYNWYAIHDARGIAPVGWHVPSNAEITTLTTCLGGITGPGGNSITIAGGKLKEIGTINWNAPNTEATNSSGFTGLPGGVRGYLGIFNNIGTDGFWWTTTENGSLSAYNLSLYYGDGSAYRNDLYKQVGHSVRCLKD